MAKSTSSFPRLLTRGCADVVDCNSDILGGQLATYLQKAAELGPLAALATFGVTGAVSGGFFVLGMGCLGGAKLLTYFAERKQQAFRDTLQKRAAGQLEDVHAFLAALQAEMDLDPHLRLSLDDYVRVTEDPAYANKPAADALADVIGLIREHIPRWLAEQEQKLAAVDAKWDGRWEMFFAVADDVAEIREDVKTLLERVAPAGVRKLTIQAPPADFTGREEARHTFRKTVERGGLLIAGYQGQGGIGKTVLARAVASDVSENFPDGQVEIDLLATTAPKSNRRAMEEVLAILVPDEKPPESDAALAARYRGQLAGRRLLLLLDNALDEAQVEPLLPPEPCGVIVTSRRLLALPGLEQHELDQLDPAEGADLARTISNRIDDRQAARLVAAVGRLALGIRLAASTVKVRRTLSVDDLLAKLESGPLSHLGGVEKALQASYDLLDEKHATFWCKLGVFATDLNALAASAVGEVTPDEAAERLDALHRDAMVNFDAAAGRFDLHDLSRAFALSRLDDAARLAAERRHAHHFAMVLAAAGDLILTGGTDYVRGLALFDAERAHVEQAWQWASARRRADPSDTDAANLQINLLDAGTYALSLRQHPRERIDWLVTAVDAAREIGDRRGEGNALGNLGLAHAALGDARRAIEYHEQALEVAREIGDRGGEGSALGNLGNAHAALGDARRAIEYHEQALEVVREIGDRRGEGNTLGNLGIAHAALGDARRAIEFYEQRMVIAREIGDRRGEGNALGNLGNAHAALGDARRAIEFYEQALEVSREIGDRRGEVNALGNLGLAHAALGDARRAIEFYEQALEVAREIGNRRGEGSALGNLGIAHAALGDARRAIEFYEQALEVAREIGDRRGEASSSFNWAVELASQSRFSDAADKAEAAAEIFEAIESPQAGQARAVAAEFRQRADDGD